MGAVGAAGLSARAAFCRAPNCARAVTRRAGRAAGRPSLRRTGGVPVFLYHGRDDEIVPFAHAGLYAKALPHAVVRPLDGRNHQLNDDLSEVAADIRRLG